MASTSPISKRVCDRRQALSRAAMLLADAPDVRVRTAPRVPARLAIADIRLWQILLIAIVLRLAALAIPAVAHPDEVFQYLEPAHRLVFGYGVTTWEWRHGMRGRLIPLLLAGPMWVGGALAPGSAAYLVLPKLLMIAISLVPVAAARVIGARLSPLHGVIAGGAAAIWYEGVYYAPHALSETLSVAAILPAAALLLDRTRWSLWRLGGAGALLGLAATLRFQHVPAIAILALAASGWRPTRAWGPLLIGAIMGLLPAALADLAMGQAPLGWIAENVRQNLVADQAANFGTSSIAGFLADNRARWALWLVPALWLAANGVRRAPALGWTAMVNLAVHMTLAHKEYRFVMLSAALLVLLAAIGTVEIVRKIESREGADRARERLRLLVVCWVLASASIAMGGFRGQWQKFTPQLDLAIALRHDPALCGLAIYRHDYSTTGAYAYLHRAVPMLYLGEEEHADAAMLSRAARYADTIMADPAHGRELPREYAERECAGGASDRMCLYRRPGGCDPAVSRYAIDRSLLRIGL